MPLAKGAVFAGYTIVRVLGSGGMGKVYLAKHPRLPRQDALKVLPETMTADNQFRERFNREADLAARLFHPHIVSVHDRGEFNGRLWISMDYVEGTDVAQLMRDRHPLRRDDHAKFIPSGRIGLWRATLTWAPEAGAASQFLSPDHPLAVLITDDGAPPAGPKRGPLQPRGGQRSSQRAFAIRAVYAQQKPATVRPPAV